jgi:amino acid adenylation domain-containing protein
MKKFNLTQSQLLMWTGQKLSPDSPMYNMALSFRIPSQINIPHFQQAFQKMLQTSDAMRTIFFEKDGKPQQRILSDFPYEMEVIDFSKKEGKEIALERFLKKHSQNVFDISTCLFDALLIKMSESEYIWYLNEHHLITDAWGTTQQYRILTECYNELSKGNDLDDIINPVYEKYIQYENQQRFIKPNEKVKEHWICKAKELPTPPSFFGKTNTQLTSESERVSITIDKEKADILRSLTQEKDLRTWTQHLSLFSIFSTLLITYLHRITGQKEIAIGTPAHNRTTPEFKATPGLFIELFPLMAEIDSEDSFSSLFQKVRDEALGFLRYAQVGSSNPGLNRGFNVVLNYINASFDDFNGIPMSSEWIHANHADPGHLLRLQVYDFDANGSIKLGFDMNHAIFSEAQRKEIPPQFLQLFNAFIEDRFQDIGKPSLLSKPSFIPEENIDFQYDDSSNIIQLFKKTVIENANKTAIQFGKESLTYEELNQHANRLSHHLIKGGLKKGARVAILLNRSPEFIISIFAILKAGAVFVPIPSNHPSGRILGIIEDANPTFILSNSILSPSLRKSFDNLIELDKEAAFINVQSAENPNIDISLDDLAYLLYTSGSTGLPKGVMIAHKSLSHYIQWAKHEYAKDFIPVMPLFTCVGFDLTITSIFLPLITGGTLITYPETQDSADLALLDVMADNYVNIIKLTPSHLGLLKGGTFPDSKIKTMIVGGENFKTNLALFVQNNIGHHIQIHNEYGPTEATVGCVTHLFNANNDSNHVSVPIGKAIPNTPVYILDEYHNPVPNGVIGELYISNVGLAKGYWKQEELTKKSFISNPFEIGEIMYCSGDLVRVDVSGTHLEYLGRKDSQVKIQGRRVELAEIETGLSQFPNIVQTVVDLRHKDHTHKEEGVHNCTECGLPSNYPSATFNDEGVCNLCESFESYQEKVKEYFKTKKDLETLLYSVKKEDKGNYDCMVLLSGGKDSTYTLAKVKELGLRVLAFTLDNGYISEGAKDNIRRIVKELGVDHVFGETEAMDAIFVDSLQRHCNVCDGCFKTIYVLSTQIALEKKIPFIITGLSRGQFFETRLTEELFNQENVNIDKIDEIILNARKEYHLVEDAVNQLLDVSMFKEDSTFEKVRYVDFFRYTDVSLQEMLDHLDSQLSWVRPEDTGRSTNCLINQAGIYVHKKELGYSNYAFPYSWDVRVGHKTRDASLDEINEVIDEKEVLRMLDAIGYTQAEEASDKNEQLVAYYVASAPIDEVQLRNHMLSRFPNYMVPVQFIPLEKLPITTNGKIDKDALPQPDTFRPILETEYVAAQNEFEEMIQDIWVEVMEIDRIGIHDNFLEIGGDSLAGIRVVSRLNQAFEIDFPVNLIFQKPTIAQLAVYIEEMIVKLMEEMEE